MNRLKRSSKAIILLLSLLVLLFMVLDINQSYENAFMLAILNTLFLGLIPISVAVIMARTYLQKGNIRFLLMSCSMLALGIGSVLAGWARFLPDSANYTVTTHNLSALLASVLNLLAAVVENPKEQRNPSIRKKAIALSFTVVCLYVFIAAAASMTGAIPEFYTEEGATGIRASILWLTIVFYFGSSFAFYQQYKKMKTDYHYWYTAAISLITIGLFAVCTSKVVGSPLSWAGRVCQYAGCLFSLLGMVAVARQAKWKKVAAAEILAEFFMDAESNYRDLVEHMSHAVILTGEGFRVLFSNPAAGELFRYEGQDMKGQPFLDAMIAETSREQLRGFVEAYVADPLGHRGEALSLEGQDKAGRVFPIELTLSVSRFSAGNVITFVIQDVTERKQAEEALKQSQEQYIELVENANCIIIRMDNNGIISFFNEYAQNYFGYSREEALGMNVKMLLPQTESISDRDLDKMADKILINPDDFVANTNENVKKNGEHVWVSWRNRAIRNADGAVIGNLAIGQDITERKQLEENLRNQNNLLESIVTNMIYGITLRDKHGDMILSNDLVCELLCPIGISRNAWEIEYERHFTDLDGNPIPLASGPIIRALGGEAVSDFRMVLKDPEAGERILEVSAVPIYSNDELVMAVSFTHDITDLVTSQKALVRQESLLLQAEKERNLLLQQAIGMKDEFLLTITHEFKTPLSVINSALQTMEMICAKDLTQRIKKYHNIIRQNSNRQLRLVNNLLDVTRMDAGRLKADRRNADIVAQTKSIVDSIAVFAEQKGLRLSFSSALESKIIGIDSEKYERILLNLLSNAVKFTPAGQSIAVVLTQKTVERKKKICIEVQDTGLGIPEDKKDLIFEKFGQVGSSRVKQAEGTGIGLHLVKLLVELLGGEVSLKSTLGQGSTFTVLLPDEEAPEPVDYQPDQTDKDSRLVQASALEFSDVYLE